MTSISRKPMRTKTICKYTFVCLYMIILIVIVIFTWFHIQPVNEALLRPSDTSMHHTGVIILKLPRTGSSWFTSLVQR